MKKLYISSPFRQMNNFFTINLMRDLIQMGYEVVNKDENTSSFDENKDSPEYWISQADVLIAILKERSATVFYEIGYATALGKEVLILLESDYDLPDSFKSYNSLRLNSGISNPVYNVIKFLKNTTYKEEPFKEHISDFKELIANLKENPQIIDRISGSAFEDIVYNYFLDNGAKVNRPESAYNDGYDFILSNWKGHHKTIVEVKKYNKNNKVSIKTIQQISGAMSNYDANHAIIITTSGFTLSAKDFSESIKKHIELWDLNYLTKNI